jgi:hypothetical protein
VNLVLEQSKRDWFRVMFSESCFLEQLKAGIDSGKCSVNLVLWNNRRDWFRLMFSEPNRKGWLPLPRPIEWLWLMSPCWINPFCSNKVHWT